MSNRSPAPRSVVVPVDGTHDATRAVPFAAALATALGCELVTVAVISDFRSEAPTLVERLREQLADLPATVERRVVQSRVIAPTIAEESEGGIVCIATTAELFDAEGFRHTITDSVIAAASSPVIVLGPNCNRSPELTRIVVAIDPSHDQDALVHWSKWLADELHSYVWPEVEAGKLKPVMDESFPLADAAKAHAHMEAGNHIGKIVLIVE